MTFKLTLIYSLLILVPKQQQLQNEQYLLFLVYWVELKRLQTLDMHYA